MKAKCSSQQMLKVIKRNMQIKADELRPEHNLILAVIGCAITDLLDKKHRRSAEAFFNHELFHRYCDLIGLHHDAAKRLLVQGGFLVA